MKNSPMYYTFSCGQYGKKLQFIIIKKENKIELKKGN